MKIFYLIATILVVLMGKSLAGKIEFLDNHRISDEDREMYETAAQTYTGYQYNQPQTSFGYPPRPGQPQIQPPRPYPGYPGNPGPGYGSGNGGGNSGESIEPNVLSIDPKSEIKPQKITQEAQDIESISNFYQNYPSKSENLDDQNQLRSNFYQKEVVQNQNPIREIEEIDPNLKSDRHLSLIDPSSWKFKLKEPSSGQAGYFSTSGNGHNYGQNYGHGLNGHGGLGLGGAFSGFKGLLGGNTHQISSSCTACSPFLDYYEAQRCCSLGHHRCCANIGVGSIGGGIFGGGGSGWPSNNNFYGGSHGGYSGGAGYGHGGSLMGSLGNLLPSLWGSLENLLFGYTNSPETEYKPEIPYNPGYHGQNPNHQYYKTLLGQQAHKEHNNRQLPLPLPLQYHNPQDFFLDDKISENFHKNDHPTISSTTTKTTISSTDTLKTFPQKSLNKCPKIPNAYTYTCKKSCSKDSECFGSRICCTYGDGCSSICSDPEENHGRFLPHTFSPKISVPLPVDERSDDLAIDSKTKNLRKSADADSAGGGFGNKPGSCARSQSQTGGYYVDVRNRVKRQSGTDVADARHYKPGTGGGFGSVGGGFGNPGYGPSPIHGGNGGGYQCYKDNDCPGNKKCCGSVCSTPAYFG